ncbi:MAG: transporter [candidate division Zixibacteria bacterium]|nr:transporter [candidate division Zixibacteria bacterium]MDH3938462.1 transporter [candidate division Zixibacteria bacterium]MDH4033728.1 transporter [candidate division Zixibacteria bacterium]
MLKKTLLIFVALSLSLATVPDLTAGGISADAGLTPAHDKWMFRTQARLNRLKNAPDQMTREMDMYMFPLVIAYGVRSDLTVMIRQPLMRMNMTMAGNTTHTTGFGDLMLMTKYRAVRRNTPTYTFGVAPLLGIKLPTGEDDISANATSLKTGLFVSGRIQPWASELNFTYTLNGLTGDDDREEYQVLEFVGAFARQFSLTEDGRRAIAPVVELSYEHATATEIDNVEQPNSGGSLLRVAPGAKLTISGVVFESLLWIPVWEDLNGNQLEYDIGGLIGLRVML